MLFRANNVLSTISNRQFKSGKYYKATDETAKLLQQRTSSGPVPGVLRRSDLGLADNPSRFFKHTSFQEVKFSPAMASGAAGIAAQAAIEAAIAEIKEYLEVIDEKLDTLLRQRKVDALAQLGGIQYTIEEADELYRRSSSVSATTWSKVDHLGSALNGIESYAIEQLDDAVDQLRKQKNNSKKLETFLAGLKGDLPLWLGVAARSIYLHDRMYVLEIAHVSEFEPRQLDSHREGIHDARKDRLESTTRRLLEMDTAIRETAKLSNQIWVTNPIRARHITAHANEIHDIISAFAQHLRMSVEDAERLHVQGWRQSVVSASGRHHRCREPRPPIGGGSSAKSHRENSRHERRPAACKGRRNRSATGAGGAKSARVDRRRRSICDRNPHNATRFTFPSRREERIEVFSTR